MPLKWEFTDKARFRRLTKQDKAYNGAFVWMSLCLDISEITEKNAPEWVWRWKFASRVNGPYYYNMVDGKRDSEYIPTVADVKKRIGLTTNVSPRTRKQFIDKVVRIFTGNLSDGEVSCRVK